VIVGSGGHRGATSRGRQTTPQSASPKAGCIQGIWLFVKPPFGFPVRTPPTKIVGLDRLFRQPGEGHDHARSTMDGQ
jgi:hypothetical protein